MSSPPATAPVPPRGLFARLGECVRERRLPYAVARAFTSQVAGRVHRPLLGALLRIGAKRKPRPVSLERARELHRRYPIRDGYKYDLAAKEERAASRLDELTGLVDLTRVRDVAEVGAGDGRLAIQLLGRGFRPCILDAADWRDDDVRAAGIPFHQLHGSGDYPLPNNSVDLVLAYNTMEHISDPPAALREMIRITRPGGRIYLSFCPIHNSPWGLHAYGTYYAPYPQFLLAPGDLEAFVAENGINDLGVDRAAFQYVNGYAAADYRRLVTDVAGVATCERFHTTRDLDHLGLVYRHLPSFWGRGLSFDELTTDSVQVLLAKKG
jgi:SAM-dependent methyltransferase